MFSEKIEIALIKRKMSKAELARQLDITPNALYSKLNRNALKEEDMKHIAEILGMRLEINFVMLDTGETF